MFTHTMVLNIRNGNETWMFKDYDNRWHDIKTKEGWEAAYHAMGFILVCPKHGETRGLSTTGCELDGFSRECGNATWGRPCIACGYVYMNEPGQYDEAHAELCCTSIKCTSPRTCETHGLGEWGQY